MQELQTIHHGILRWNKFYVQVNDQTYAMFQIRVMDLEGYGRNYTVINQSLVEQICTIQVTSSNLSDFLKFVDCNQSALRHEAPVH
jgi:hypothetical protein